MRALCWNGINNLSVEKVNDPMIINPKDVIIKVNLSSVCGSDLHLINGYVPGMKKGDILGHEFVGEVVETGWQVKNIKNGDRVVAGHVIACGSCKSCEMGQWSLCDNSNPNGWMEEKVFGCETSGVIGYSHFYGGYAGSHAEYIRVPYAETGTFQIPEEISYEQALFSSNAFPTGYMAAEMGNISPGDIVAVWGCGAVGQMAIKSAFMLGAGRVIAIDKIPERLKMAKENLGAEVLNFDKLDIQEALKETTGGRGPDICIDAVGMEAEAKGLDYAYDQAREKIRIQTDHSCVLNQMIKACRKGGTVSIIGIYNGYTNHFPIGAAMNKSLNLRMGQINPPKYIPKLLDLIKDGKADLSYLITHKMPLEKGAEGYKIFKEKKDNCVRVVFNPQMAA